MSKWDNRIMHLIGVVATWSRDPSTKVGAAIVDDKNRIVSIGFNGPPRGVEDDPGVTRDEKLRRTIHAEENALLFANRPLEGCTIYTTHPPCATCAAKIVQSGVGRVVTRRPDAKFSHRWDANLVSAMRMFDEAGVLVDYLEEA